MARRTLVSPDGVRFRDLDGDGIMAPYEDPRRTPGERVADLLPRLSLAEKVGLVFQTILGVGEVGDHDTAVGLSPETTRDLVVGKGITHFNVRELPPAREAAAWQNAVQDLAATTPHGIPVTFSSDPRHGFTANDGVAFVADGLSQWPEPLGLAALGDPEVVRRFADTARQEYRALGLRAALHPQVDLATEPRWGRQLQSFGERSAVASQLVVAYLEGMQGTELGPDGVACTTKHFPGGGPQRDGEDPHFVYGREQDYPGYRFAEHLAPFRAAVQAGTGAVMPSYGIPVGQQLHGEALEEVAFAFSRPVVTGLLREELGFDGVVVTDWGLVTDVEMGGRPFPARAWGVEHLSPLDRVARLLEAGNDQLGGESCTELVEELVRTGRVTECRIDASARRLLLVKFRLGLFDDPYVDEGAAERVVGCPAFREAGHRAQAEAVVLLADRGVLPLRPTRVHLTGIEADELGPGWVVVDEPGDAELALVRLAAPFEPRDTYFLEAAFHQGSLQFPVDVVNRVQELAAVVPVVLDVHLDRPAVLTELDAVVSVLSVSFGASTAALLDAWTGRIPPRGRLPVELPRSMDAVLASRPDVPSDTVEPLYPYGAGLVHRR